MKFRYLNSKPNNLLLLLLSLQLTPLVFAEDKDTLNSNSRLTTQVRIRNFNEFMSPSLGNGDQYIPKHTGNALVPAFVNSQLNIDYEFDSGYRIFYLQKNLLFAPSNEAGASISGRLIDPRFGFRKTSVFPIENLTTEYDIFIQPGLTQTILKQPNRAFDVGIRLVHRYAVPGSRWTLGSNFELVTTFYSQASTGANVSGLLAFSGSYRLSKLISTQHWFTSYYKHINGDPVLNFSWDITGMPFFQNGISLDLSKVITLSILLNQYAFEIPRFENMWASLWVSLLLT